jgi:hypothetical protein
MLLLLVMLASQVALGAQHDHAPQAKVSRPPGKVAPTPDPRSLIPENLGWEPIRCWRQSTAGAVTIGEMFTVVLTCAVYEGDNAQVVPDESRLGVASIQMAPFEILGGSHPPDVRRGSRRFFQYDYQLRIISQDAPGSDTNIPPLTISYRIHSRVGAAATLEGRDLSYLLPMMPIKVLSLVPADAVDIRDAAEASLGAVDSLRFRSSLFRVLALTFGALASVMVVLALVPLARSRRTASSSEREGIPDRAILSRVASELGDVQSHAAREGWNEALVARAIPLVRIVAAAAIDQPISQRPVPAEGGAHEGRLLVKHGNVRPLTATVSSSVTADDVARARESRAAKFSMTRQQQLEGLQDGLSAMTAALYRSPAVALADAGKSQAHDGPAYDEVLRHAITVGKEIAAERSWVKSLLRQGSGGQARWGKR